jgi:hypothetical protein
MQPGSTLQSDVSAQAYHADPAPKPSLSASIARVLVKRSPRHAWHKQPRLNVDLKPKPPTQEMEDGTALHRLVLGAGSPLAIAPYDSWQSDAAKHFRAAARKNHATPVLRERYERILLPCAASARKQMKAHQGCSPLFAPGLAEVVAIWLEGSTYCRLRVDWLPSDPTLPVCDLKFTSKSAAPEDWESEVWKEHGLRSAWYLRGLAAVRGVAPPEYRLVVVEISEPFAVSVFAAAADVLAEGREQVDDALEIWGACMRLKRWPGYAPVVNRVEFPPWRAAKWEEDQPNRRALAPVARTRRGKGTPEQVARLQAISSEMGKPLS